MNYYTYIHIYNQSILNFIVMFPFYLFRNIGFIPKIKEIRRLAIGSIIKSIQKESSKDVSHDFSS